jgi:ankyrin repeat protein
MLLLRKDDFDVDRLDQHRCSALLLAAQNGHEDVIRILLATGQININTEEENGITPFIHAAWGGHGGAVTNKQTIY